MNSMILFGAFCAAAYVLQILLGLKQLKNFNVTYGQLRKLGRVAIGRRSGKIKSGTIVLFALNREDMPAYIGQDLHYLDRYNPLVRQENKLLQIAIEDAREVFLRVEAGNYQDVPKYGSALDVTTNAKYLLSRFKYHFKKS